MTFRAPDTENPREASPFWKAYAERNAPKASSTPYAQLRGSLAIPFVAMTVVITVFSGLGGMYPILLLYAMWLPQIFLRKPFLLRPSRDVVPLYIFAGFCLASVAWSNYRVDTMRVSIEFISTVICAVIISRTVSMKFFLKGITVGTAIVLMAAFMNGGYSDEVFGSKNQVGLVAEISLYACTVFFFAKNPVWEKIVFAIGPGTIAAVCMVLSHSASSDASLAMALGVGYTAYLLSKFPARVRKPVLIVGIVSVIALASLGFYLGVQGEAFQVMGKDTSLTGRTYLWGEGLKAGMEMPVLGHGYSAFWVPGQPQAERYWYEFQIFGRTGFHFHNLYIQTFVDIGAVGFLILAFLILSSCYRSFIFVIKEGANMNNVYFIGMSLMIFIRGFVEVDILGPFTLGGILFYSLFPRIHLPIAEDAVAGAPSRIGNPEEPQMLSRRPE